MNVHHVQGVRLEKNAYAQVAANQLKNAASDFTSQRSLLDNDQPQKKE